MLIVFHDVTLISENANDGASVGTKRKVKYIAALFETLYVGEYNPNFVVGLSQNAGDMFQWRNRFRTVSDQIAIIGTKLTVDRQLTASSFIISAPLIRTIYGYLPT